MCPYVGVSGAIFLGGQSSKEPTLEGGKTLRHLFTFLQ
jgi:hypothetical protein